MLGTNDSKDHGSGGPSNWPHDCTGAGAATCPFTRDYTSMIELVRTLGTTPAGPDIYVAVPPPLRKDGVYGMNSTVINHVFPDLIPYIRMANNLQNEPIDIFDASKRHATHGTRGARANSSRAWLPLQRPQWVARTWTNSLAGAAR